MEANDFIDVWKDEDGILHIDIKYKGRHIVKVCGERYCKKKQSCEPSTIEKRLRRILPPNEKNAHINRAVNIHEKGNIDVCRVPLLSGDFVKNENVSVSATTAVSVDASVNSSSDIGGLK